MAGASRPMPRPWPRPAPSPSCWKAWPNRWPPRSPREIAIPTIGIGASPACDGQILVMEDMLGLNPNPPKFVRAICPAGPGHRGRGQGLCRGCARAALPGRGKCLPDETGWLRPGLSPFSPVISCQSPPAAAKSSRAVNGLGMRASGAAAPERGYSRERHLPRSRGRRSPRALREDLEAVRRLHHRGRGAASSSPSPAMSCGSATRRTSG